MIAGAIRFVPLCGAQVEEMLLSALRVAAATPMVLLCPSQFKHFPMNFPSENVLHVELKRYPFFVCFFDKSLDCSFLPLLGHL